MPSSAALRTALSLDSTYLTTSLSPFTPTDSKPLASTTRAISSRHAACVRLFLDLSALVTRGAYLFSG